LSWIDWLVVFVPLAVVVWVGWRTKRYMLAVSDFLAGGRVAGRYIVAVAGSTASLGLISVVALLEMYYRSGFAIGFWSALEIPVGLVIALTGFGIYRYRETRAMTLAQFFELRYSRSFRVFAGLLAWVSGVVNYAIFPAVGARFIVYYGGLPPEADLFFFRVPTFALVMAAFLGVALLIVISGGQLTNMVIDCVAGLFSYALYAVVIVAILCLFSWSQMKEALLDRPVGQSMLNPFDTARLQDFNVFYVLVAILANVYGVLSWQGTQGYNAAAASPHEQKMGRVLGVWRAGMSTLMMILLAVAAYTYLHHPDFTQAAAAVEQELARQINLDSEAATATIRDQMRVPLAIKHILPVGVTGAFFAVMMLLLVTTDTTYLHSWGAIFVQDVVLPVLNKPLTPRQQIWLLRGSILLVALFAFFFSLFFNQVTYILMFMALTGSLWLGGAGIVILGGLYWKKGTAAGAWAGMLAGASLAVGGFMLTQFWADPIYPYVSTHYPNGLASFARLLEGLGAILPFVYWQVTPDRFPITGQEILFLTMVAATLGYVVGSLLTFRQPFNLDRMLHRGVYRRAADGDAAPPSADQPAGNWKSVLLGFDSQFTRGDKLLSGSVFVYSMLLFVVFLAVVAWNLFVEPFSRDAWAKYFWVMNIGLALAVGVVTSIWFTCGSLRDLRRMFHKLAGMSRNVLDDGRVVEHKNVEDLAFVAETTEDNSSSPGPRDPS